MTLKIKYFGAIAEEAGMTEESIDLDKPSISVSELKQLSEEKHRGISALSYQIAINKKLMAEGAIQEGDEVAFLPPFAGG